MIEQRPLLTFISHLIMVIGILLKFVDIRKEL